MGNTHGTILIEWLDQDITMEDASQVKSTIWCMRLKDTLELRIYCFNMNIQELFSKA